MIFQSRKMKLLLWHDFNSLIPTLYGQVLIICAFLRRILKQKFQKKIRFRNKICEKIRFWNKLFFQKLWFWIEIFTACQILKKNIWNVSVFESSFSTRIRFCFEFLTSCKFLSLVFWQFARFSFIYRNRARSRNICCIMWVWLVMLLC